MSKWFVLVFAALLGTGCATVAVTNGTLVTRTAHALRLDPGTLEISNRKDEGTITRYVATTDRSERYNCHVGGSLSVITSSSAAMCLRIATPRKNPPHD